VLNISARDRRDVSAQKLPAQGPRPSSQTKRDRQLGTMMLVRGTRPETGLGCCPSTAVDRYATHWTVSPRRTDCDTSAFFPDSSSFCVRHYAGCLVYNENFIDPFFAMSVYIIPPIPSCPHEQSCLHGPMGTDVLHATVWQPPPPHHFKYDLRMSPTPGRGPNILSDNTHVLPLNSGWDCADRSRCVGIERVTHAAAYRDM